MNPSNYPRGVGINLSDLPSDLLDMPDQTDIPDIELDPKILFSALETGVPLLMLPVRIETRFYHEPEHLRIRIYPDQIHVNNHQNELSKTEASLGLQFWDRVWKRGSEKAQGAFTKLSEKLGPWRAAWVLDATAPTNLVNIGQDEPVFPEFAIDRDPTAPSKLALLPHYWTAVGILNGEVVFEETGNRIPDTLRFAPFQMQNGDEIARWMIEFDKAVEVGMALEIRLSGSKAGVADNGLDELYVLGVRSGKPLHLAHQLEETLRGHFYTRGFDFVPQGTATNNTEHVRSPWQWDSADTTDLYRRILQPTPAIAGSSRDRFAQALGLNVDGIVNRASQGDLLETPTMEAMNLALWYIMWGEYLRFVLHDGENAALPDSVIDELRDWFVNHVRGGAPYPAFHIGSMPYGVLPIQIQPVPADPYNTRTYLQWVLLNLRETWEESLPNVPHLDPTATASSTDAAETDLEAANENLVSILSSHAHPVRFFVRGLDNLREGWSAIFFDPVTLYELVVSVLIERIQERDSGWADEIENDLQNNFTSMDEQQNYFQDILDETYRRGFTDAAESAESVMMLLNAHVARVHPVTSLGLPPLMDVLSEATPNPEHFYFHYDNDVTEWGALPLVQPDESVDGATPGVYLPWLCDYARGTVDGTGPEGLSDPAPLLFQLIKKAISSANDWDGGAVADLNDIFSQVSDIAQLKQPADRLNATTWLAANSRKLSSAANLLNTSLDSPQTNATRRALSQVPRSTFRDASKHLQDYRRVSREVSPNLNQLIDALDKWANLPTMRTLDDLIGRTVVIPGARARAIGEALLDLAELPPEALEQRLIETLGLAMHRLDAWITAYAEERVDILREKKPTGIQIGGYGWVENLRPDPIGESATQGYIHAASMTHAAMAAVLRSGYSAFSDGTATSPLSVDLRSDRVRVASWMMDGVRQGQRINDLLGYRFERYLHDHNLDVWIQAMREVVTEKGTTELAGSSQLVTVDGLALLELWDEGKGTLEADVKPPLNADKVPYDFDDVVPALEQLVWITDSMADLALAESVHAILQGDYERASAVQNAAALGDVPPPELRSMRTPNSGMSVTHRLLLMPQGAASEWTHHGTSIRSAVEPSLETWAASILGVPGDIAYRVSGGPDSPEETKSLLDLPLSALDAIYLAPTGGMLAGSALHALIVSDYRLRHDDPDHPIADVIVDADYTTSSDQVTLNEFCLLAASLRRLLGDARAATVNDFVQGVNEETEALRATDAQQLMKRALDLLQRFSAAIDSLDSSQIDVRKALLNITGFNLPQAIPSSNDEQVLAEQAAAVHTAAEEHLKKAQKAIHQLRKNESNQTSEKQINTAHQVFAIILGRDFPIMTHFDLPLDTAIIQAETVLNSDAHQPNPVMGWLLKMARVRPELAPLRETITAAEALQDRSLFPFWVAQTPHHAGEAWVGSGHPGEDANDRLSLVLTSNGNLTEISEQSCALVLDQWTERIPTDYEMTGLTFHYDAPTSRPPQALLLAMPPEGQLWGFSVALDTVREASALARLRAVAPESLGDYGHQIPAVYLSSSLDTIGATDGL